MFSAATKTGSQPSAAANYIEDVFSTYLYTGTGATQSINNGIDESGKGALTWIKRRDTTGNHLLFDTTRGMTSSSSPFLSSNTTSAETAISNYVIATSTGFNLGSSATGSYINASGGTYASWTFRKQPKFFDVVTYTGTGSAQNINHSLGSVPGMIIIKSTTNTRGWAVYHKDIGNTSAMYLNTTQAAFASDPVYWNNTSPTSTQFTVNYWTANNATGETYVAYLFAHDAGGFGTSGTDNVISCGSFTTDGSGNATVNLGYEPQYILCKYSSSASNWYVFDTMRGLSLTEQRALFPNQSYAENGYSGTGLFPTATGFSTLGTSLFDPNATLIYMAIRRPMKVPTDATTVFSPNAVTPNATSFEVTTGFPVDLVIPRQRSADGTYVTDRLRGSSKTTYNFLQTQSTSPEQTGSGYGFGFDNNTGILDNGFLAYSGAPATIYWNFRRASGFFDEVCYTGTGSGTSPTHNLGVIPELKIIKRRNFAQDWIVGGSIISGVGGRANYALLNTTDAVTVNSTYWDVADTSTTFSVRAGNGMSDTSGGTYVAYLFATCPGVSKVGSYTGTGATQTINCGFTGGARFVLIKRTDSTGDWYVWDTARGMVSGTDPSLLLNSTAAEVNANSVYTATTGFQIVSTAAGINASGGSYIFLAIA